MLAQADIAERLASRPALAPSASGAESRTMKAGGAFGFATIGALASRPQDVLPRAQQHAVLPLLPYIDSLRWACIAAALGCVLDVTRGARADGYSGC